MHFPQKFSHTILLVLLLFLIGCAGNSGLQNKSGEAGLEKGSDTAKSGDYARGLKIFRLLAEQGDAISQFALGEAYYEGHGVPQDNIRAYMWLDISGWEEAKEYLNIVEKKMTPAEISKAQELVQQCVANNYKGC